MSFTEALCISAHTCPILRIPSREKVQRIFSGQQGMHDCVVNDFRCNPLKLNIHIALLKSLSSTSQTRLTAQCSSVHFLSRPPNNV